MLPWEQIAPTVLLLGLVIVYLVQARRTAHRDRQNGAPDDRLQALSRLQKTGRRPDMAFSAGRDAAHQINMARDIHIPMPPETEPQMRLFYLDLLGMTEMRAPNQSAGLGGFWAILGRRRVHFGTTPGVDTDPVAIPTLAVSRLDAMADRLTAAGHVVVWDTRLSYARRLGVVDPAGNTIALIGG